MKTQPDKDKKSLSEIGAYCGDSFSLLNIFSVLLGEFDLRYINSLFSGAKTRGIDGKQVFRPLFLLRFLDFDNTHQLMGSGLSKELSHKKDVFYGFLNNHRIDWRRIVRLFFKQALAIIAGKSVDGRPGGHTYLIADDTLLEKSGKTMELIGKVFDHSSHLFKLGMKVLALGYSDGKSFMPIDFSVHGEQGKTKKRGMKAKELDAQYSKERGISTPGHQRESEVFSDKISVALQMIGRCGKKWLRADYVLADSWFICERFITGIKRVDKGLDVIGLMKTNRIVVIGGRRYMASKIPEIRRKNIHYSNKLKCRYISLGMSYKGIEMRGFWVKMKGRDNWKLLISTDCKLAFIKAMEHYQNRWSIEVFFRDCKQNLGLNNCQSKDLDAHIATISLVFMNYTVLAIKKRFDDYETLGILFRDFKEMMLKQTIAERIWAILIALFDSVFAEMGVEWEKFITTLINSEQEILGQISKTFESLFSIRQKDSPLKPLNLSPKL